MGGCTNCKSKGGCDDRKGVMLEQVADALDRLYPDRVWCEHVGAPHEDLAGLADELATELDAATFVVAGDACDYIYVLALGRPPCAVQVRDFGVAPPAEWDGSTIEETYLRVCVSRVARMAAVQEVAIDASSDRDGMSGGGAEQRRGPEGRAEGTARSAAPRTRASSRAGAAGIVIRERPRAGVYSAPMLKRMQRLVAILPAYDLVHLDFGEISAAPAGFAPGAWRARFGGAPATANYLFFAEPTTMVTTAWVPREAGAHAC